MKYKMTEKGVYDTKNNKVIVGAKLIELLNDYNLIDLLCEKHLLTCFDIYNIVEYFIECEKDGKI